MCARALRVALLLLPLLFFLCAAGSARAAEPLEDVDSPRAALRAYYDLCRAGEYAEAARYLDVADKHAKEADALARNLKAVLDRYGPIELDAASMASAGEGNDKLPPGVDEIGKIRTPLGTHSVRLVKRRDKEGRWMFSRSTVDQVPRWFGTLEDRWVYERLPRFLTRELPGDLLVWQLAAGIALLLLARIGGSALSRLGRAVLPRILKGRADPDGANARVLADLLLRPSMFFFTFLLFYAGRSFLRLPPASDAVVTKALRIGLVLSFFWVAVRVVEATSARLLRRVEGEVSAERRSVVPLATTTAKIIAFLLAIAATLSELGYEATSIIAGVGIGGLGLALAAQKTVEHLFGSISIGVDQPFKVGDLVKIDDVLGTVEHVGLRSTRIRTFDRTIVTFPNGKLADMKIESFDPRDRIRLHMTLGLSHSSKADQVRAILKEVEDLLRSHEKIWTEDMVVRLKAIGESTLDVEIMAWFVTRDVPEFQRIREAMLLGFLEIVERAGTTLAFPTRTLHVSPAALLRAE